VLVGHVFHFQTAVYLTLWTPLNSGRPGFNYCLFVAVISSMTLLPNQLVRKSFRDKWMKMSVALIALNASSLLMRFGWFIKECVALF